MTAEAALVLALVSQRVYASRLEDDYRTFAVQHAGVTGEHQHQFYVDIGNWDTREEFNQQRLRYREHDLVSTRPEDDWNWDSSANRMHFKDLRIRSDNARQRALLLVGGIIINHIASFVDASAFGGGKPVLGAAVEGNRVWVGVNLGF